MVNWNVVRRFVVSLVTVAASSVTLILPILISNPNDAKIQAAPSRIQDAATPTQKEAGSPIEKSALSVEDAGPSPEPQLLKTVPRLTSFLATAYSLRGNTRSGIPVRRGIVAADPDVLPIGSIIRIHSPHCAGVYTVLDSGLNLRGRKIDIYMPKRKDAIRFGSRRVNVEILRHGWTPEVAVN